MKAALQRAQEFCERFGLRVPILLAPMAGASAPSLSIAVADAGGLGACGAVLMKPDEILAWANEVRGETNRRFQINLWIPDPPPAARCWLTSSRCASFWRAGDLRCRPKRAMQRRLISRGNARHCWKRRLQSCPRLWVFIPHGS